MPQSLVFEEDDYLPAEDLDINLDAAGTQISEEPTKPSLVEFEHVSPKPIEDVYLAGSTIEQEEQANYKAEKAREKTLNEMGDADLRKTMAMLMAKLERQERLMRQLGQNGGLVVANSDGESLSKQFDNQLRGKSKVRVLIHTSENLSNNFPVMLRVNGALPPKYPNGVPRGIDVELPIPYVELLQHALISGWQKIVGPDGNPKQVHVHQLRYPFSILG